MLNKPKLTTQHQSVIATLIDRSALLHSKIDESIKYDLIDHEMAKEVLGGLKITEKGHMFYANGGV